MPRKHTGANDLIKIAAELVHETEKAFLITDGELKVWVPQSQVVHHEEEGVFEMPEWLAIEKELV